MKQPRRIQVRFSEEPGWTVPVQLGQPSLLLASRSRFRALKPQLSESASFLLSRFRSAA